MLNGEHEPGQCPECVAAAGWGGTALSSRCGAAASSAHATAEQERGIRSECGSKTSLSGHCSPSQFPICLASTLQGRGEEVGEPRENPHMLMCLQRRSRNTGQHNWGKPLKNEVGFQRFIAEVSGKHLFWGDLQDVRHGGHMTSGNGAF